MNICKAREIKRLVQDSRPSYWKLYIVGEALHQEYDTEEVADRAAERINKMIEDSLKGDLKER